MQRVQNNFNLFEFHFVKIIDNYSIFSVKVNILDDLEDSTDICTNKLKLLCNTNHKTILNHCPFNKFVRLIFIYSQSLIEIIQKKKKHYF